MRFILYARKSSESDDRQALSIESQIDTLRALAERRGLTIVKIFREAMSAKAPGRPEFNAMLQMLNEGKADGILCWKTDRLARNPIDAGSISWGLQSGKICKIVTPERDHTPEDNVLLMSVEFGMATQFSLELSKNVTRGMETKAKLGWLPSKPPCGYLNEPITRAIVEDPYNFPLVLELFRLALTGQYRVVDLLDIANTKLHIKQRIKGRLVDGSIGKHMVHGMLRNPFYAGFFVRNGQRYQGAHKPMITEAEHKKLLEIYGTSECKDKSVAVLAEKRKKYDYKLSGIIRCPCGRQVVPWPIKNRAGGRQYFYYVCASRFEKNKAKRCGEKAVRAENIEEQLERQIINAALHPKLLAWLRGNADAAHRQLQERQAAILQSLQQRLEQCEARKAKLLNLVLADAVTEEDYKAKCTEIDVEVASIKKEQAASGERMNHWRENYKAVADIGEAALTVFRTGTHEEVKKVLRGLAKTIVLSDRQVNLQLRRPFQTLTEVIGGTPDISAVNEAIWTELQG